MYLEPRSAFLALDKGYLGLVPVEIRINVRWTVRTARLIVRFRLKDRYGRMSRAFRQLAEFIRARRRLPGSRCCSSTR